nr:MAG TPA: hypothetical protein [Caudoviricetes sp.]
MRTRPRFPAVLISAERSLRAMLLRSRGPRWRVPWPERLNVRGWNCRFLISITVVLLYG